jgi:putrescine transport system permease protein
MTSLNRRLGSAFLALVFAFFYAPIASVVVYSFNESPVASEWTRFSVQWYGRVAHDQEVLDAVRISVELALATACAATVLGAWIGLVLASWRRFAGRTLFTAMVNAPMVLPEVISGISLLLLFVGLEQLTGWPEGRGMVTMWVGHVMLCIAYVAITVQARLAAIEPSLGEAARDLGATHAHVFFDVTLPLIAPALVSGWLLSFTISIDDVVMSAFLCGPDTTTLPLVLLSRMRIGLDPEINALGTLLITVVGVIVAGNGWFVMKREQRRARELRTALAADPPAAPGAAGRPVPDT